VNLAPTDREIELAARAEAAFAHGSMPPSSSSFTDLCIVTRESGRVAPDRTFFLLAWARLLGWRGGPDVTVALDPLDDRAEHVPRAAAVSTALVAHRAGWVAEVDLRTVGRAPQPTLDDPHAARVELDPSTLADRRSHDVAATVPLATILLAADCVGAARGALDASLFAVRERPLFGGVVADRQVVRHRCADMAIAVTRGWDLVLDAAARVDRGDEPDTVALAAAHAKVLVSEHARRVTADALRLAGGRGVLDDEPWSRWYRRVKAAEPLLGSPRTHRAAVARAHLGRWR
jgi:alkylation response protein AidB-like acyl-CoA dehydrogenase